MKNLGKIKLRDSCSKIGSGATPRGGDASYKEEGISLIRSQNILDFVFSKNGLAFIDDEQAKALSNVKIKERDVLINITGDSVARVCQVPDEVLPARVNQHVSILRTNQSKLNPEFLKYALLTRQSKELLLSLASTGATRKALTKTMLEEFEIDAPEDVELQFRIASILSSLDDKIELNRRMNQTLEKMAQTLFNHYFVDNIDPANLPERWSYQKVSSIFKINIGRTPPRVQTEWFTKNIGDVKWISIKDMGNCGAYIFDTSEFLTADAVKRFNVPKIPDNTIILSFKLTVGRVAITTGEMLSNEAIAHFNQMKDNYLTPYYTYLFLKEFDYNSLGNTSSIATAVNSQTIKDLSILVPDENTVAKFSNKVAPLFLKIKTNTREINSLTKIRDILLPKLMSGEIDVDALMKEETLLQEEAIENIKTA